MRIELHGENHSDVADTYCKIASSYYDLDDHKQLLEYFQKSLAIRMKLYGELHADVA
jgi:hypothetical protein